MENQKAKIISFYFQKGGVGKTTTAINIAAYLSTFFVEEETQRRNKVLFIDADPHASATKYLGCYDINGDTIYDVFKGKKRIPDVVKHFEYEYFGAEENNICSIDFVPSTENMQDISTNYFMLKYRDARLNLALREVMDKYDYILIDCPPQTQALFKNIFNVTDYFILCTEALTMDIDALGHSYRMINELTTLKGKAHGKILGIVVDKYFPNFRVDIMSNTRQKDIVQRCASKFYVFNYKIPFSECVCTSSSRRIPMPFFHKQMHNSKDTHRGFINLTLEILERIKEMEAK